jgi:hypothetical protein
LPLRYQGSVNLQLAARVCVPSRHGCKSLFSHASTLLDRPTRACGSREVPVQLDDAGCGAASAGSDWASARQHQHRQRKLTCDSDATMQACKQHANTRLQDVSSRQRLAPTGRLRRRCTPSTSSSAAVRRSILPSPVAPPAITLQGRVGVSHRGCYSSHELAR